MKTLLFNLLLALIWGALSGDMRISNLALGFLVGYIILFLTQRVYGGSRYFNKVLHITRFLAFFLKEMWVASLRVAHDVLTPTSYHKPGIIAYPLVDLTDFEITFLATIISLTPGTLSMDVSEDRKILFIHAMFIDEVDTLKAEIKERLEEPLLEVMR